MCAGREAGASIDAPEGEAAPGAGGDVLRGSGASLGGKHLWARGWGGAWGSVRTSGRCVPMRADQAPFSKVAPATNGNDPFKQAGVAIWAGGRLPTVCTMDRAKSGRRRRRGVRGRARRSAVTSSLRDPVGSAFPPLCPKVRGDTEHRHGHSGQEWKMVPGPLNKHTDPAKSSPFVHGSHATSFAGPIGQITAATRTPACSRSTVSGRRR